MQKLLLICLFSSMKFSLLDQFHSEVVDQFRIFNLQKGSNLKIHVDLFNQLLFGALLKMDIKFDIDSIRSFLSSFEMEISTYSLQNILKIKNFDREPLRFFIQAPNGSVTNLQTKQCKGKDIIKNVSCFVLPIQIQIGKRAYDFNLYIQLKLQPTLSTTLILVEELYMNALTTKDDDFLDAIKLQELFNEMSLYQIGILNNNLIQQFLTKYQQNIHFCNKFVVESFDEHIYISCQIIQISYKFHKKNHH